MGLPRLDVKNKLLYEHSNDSAIRQNRCLLICLAHASCLNRKYVIGKKENCAQQTISWGLLQWYILLWIVFYNNIQMNFKLKKGVTKPTEVCSESLIRHLVQLTLLTSDLSHVNTHTVLFYWFIFSRLQSGIMTDSSGADRERGERGLGTHAALGESPLAGLKWAMRGGGV